MSILFCFKIFQISTIMKSLLLTLFICFAFGTFSQNWAPVGAEWYNEKYPLYEPGVTFSKIEVEKDTVLSGQLCSKLIGKFNCPWGSAPKFTYESNDTVYFYHDETQEFIMLYDLEASPGDTWEINYLPSFLAFDTIKILVDSIGDITVDGEMLRVVHITQTNEHEVGVGLYGPIIERIGAPTMLTNFF